MDPDMTWHVPGISFGSEESTGLCVWVILCEKLLFKFFPLSKKVITFVCLFLYIIYTAWCFVLCSMLEKK